MASLVVACEVASTWAHDAPLAAGVLLQAGDGPAPPGATLRRNGHDAARAHEPGPAGCECTLQLPGARRLRTIRVVSSARVVELFLNGVYQRTCRGTPTSTSTLAATPPTGTQHRRADSSEEGLDPVSAVRSEQGLFECEVDAKDTRAQACVLRFKALPKTSPDELVLASIAVEASEDAASGGATTGAVAAAAAEVLGGPFDMGQVGALVAGRELSPSARELMETLSSSERAAPPAGIEQLLAGIPGMAGLAAGLPGARASGTSGPPAALLRFMAGAAKSRRQQPTPAKGSEGGGDGKQHASEGPGMPPAPAATATATATATTDEAALAGLVRRELQAEMQGLRTYIDTKFEALEGKLMQAVTQLLLARP